MKRFVALAVLLLPAFALAHDVPDDVKVTLFLKPEGQHLRILARVPTNAMVDVLFPLKDGEVFIDSAASDPEIAEGSRLWVSNLLRIAEDGERLPRPKIVEARLSQGTDPSFGSWNDAVAHVTGPKLPSSALLAWNRATVDVLLDVPIRSDRSDFVFTPRFARIGVRVTTTLTFLPPSGPSRIFVYEGDPEPFHLNPTASETLVHFFRIGFTHMREETDHLLLLFAVAVLFRRIRALVPFTIAFSAAHLAALVCAALGAIPAGLWFGPAIGILVSVTIVYIAFESVVTGGSPRTRRVVAILGGIAFGYSFWFFLTPLMQYGGAHPVSAVAAYGAGIEISQIPALAFVILLVTLLRKSIFPRPAGTIVLAVVAAHMEWHRMIERAYALARYSVQWPVLDPATGLLPVLAAILLLALAWSVSSKWMHARRAS